MLQRSGKVVIAILAGLSIALGTDEDAVSNIEGSKDGVTVRVSCPKSFASNRDVEISYSVINRSESVYGLVYAHGLQDVQIRLIGPNGDQISTYHEREGWPGSFNVKRHFIEKVEPGKELVGDSVPLSVDWPMERVGEYRCRLTKKIYRTEPPVGERLNISNPGTSVEIQVPEFTFRIESIDPNFKSSWAPRSAAKISDLKDGKVMSPLSWVVCVGGILALAWVFLKK